MSFLLSLFAFTSRIVGFRSLAPLKPSVNTYGNVLPEVLHKVVETDERLTQNGGRVIIVGDVHGCFDELLQLLDSVSFCESRDMLVLVGDLVNKGPKSVEVVEFAMQKNNVHCVKGNHEENLLMKLRSPQFKRDESSYCRDLTKEEINWLEQLPYTLFFPSLDCYVVHAGLVPNVQLEEQSPFDMVNMRNVEESSVETGKYVAHKKAKHGVGWASVWRGKHIYFGHDAKRGLQQLEHATGLDTGACYGRELTAVVLPEKRIVQVSVSNEYAATGKRGDE